MQVPDAVYHLMRHTALKGCNLSSNVITKIPPKFAVKFSLITGLGSSISLGGKGPSVSQRIVWFRIRILTEFRMSVMTFRPHHTYLTQHSPPHLSALSRRTGFLQK